LYKLTFSKFINDILNCFLGHPMKLIFFVSPYDLLDVENNTIMNLDKESLDVGCYATVCIEAATTTNVQSTSLLSATRSATGIK